MDEEDCPHCNRIADEIRKRNLLRRTFNAVREKANTPEKRCPDCGRTPREKIADARHERNLLGRSLFRLRDKYASIQADKLFAEEEAEEAARVAKAAKAERERQKKKEKKIAKQIQKEDEAYGLKKKEAMESLEKIKKRFRTLNSELVKDGLEPLEERKPLPKAKRPVADEAELARLRKEMFAENYPYRYERIQQKLQAQPGQPSSASTRPSYLSGGYRYTSEWFNYCF